MQDYSSYMTLLKEKIIEQVLVKAASLWGIED